jgi:hypothetical protein
LPGVGYVEDSALIARVVQNYVAAIFEQRADVCLLPGKIAGSTVSGRVRENIGACVVRNAARSGCIAEFHGHIDA